MLAIKCAINVVCSICYNNAMHYWYKNIIYPKMQFQGVVTLSPVLPFDNCVNIDISFLILHQNWIDCFVAFNS